MARDEIVRHCERTRRELFEAIAGLTEEQMRRCPHADEWSVAEILAHLPAFERRMRLQASTVCRRSGSDISFLPDEERKEAAARGTLLPLPAIIHDLVAARWETMKFLDDLSTGDFAKRGRHAQYGEMSVEAILRAISDHERQHVKQIAELREKLGLERAPAR
jgi:hypothetical protein